MQLLISLVIGVVLLSGVEGSKCPSVVTPMCHKLNAAAYKGLWYEQTHSKDFIWDFGCKCTTADYTIKSTDPLLISVNNSCTGKKSGKRIINIGKAKANATASGECALEVAFYGNFYGPYLVLDTDYKTYSIVVSCLPGLENYVSDIWILARQRQLPKPKLNMLISKLKTMGFDYSDVVYTEQTGCQ
eukprot:TRINITY_DN67323_c5_g1_i1.p1 TRINITY_DN67323_c5_g1~~TRINITY_DN67323_c5_g1_i1.p1  ORF type:complete len:187 (-),score=16.96 TRINITY_DN67323_c5_g1_i1:125-685(-)